MYWKLATRLLVFSLAAAVAALFYINFCHLIFRCGCHSVWNGAAVACNIHQPGPPDCPWCRPEWWSGYAPLYGVLVVQAAAAFWPGSRSAGVRFAVALAAFPVVGTILGLALGLATGYWSS